MCAAGSGGGRGGWSRTEARPEKRREGHAPDSVAPPDACRSARSGIRPEAPLAPSLATFRSIGRPRHLEPDRRGPRRPPKAIMETVIPREIGAPLGHPGRSLRCPRPPRTIRSRRARPDTHERPLLCGRCQRQLLCTAGARRQPKGSRRAVDAAGGDRHVLHAIGSVASVGPNGRHAERSARRLGLGRSPLQAQALR